MGDALTSVLEALAVLAIAIGIFILLGMGGWAWIAAGGFLLLASFVASALNAAPPPRRSDE